MTVLGKRAQIIFLRGAFNELFNILLEDIALSNIHLTCDVNQASYYEGCHDLDL
jgi:hypothetical protein